MDHSIAAWRSHDLKNDGQALLSPQLREHFSKLLFKLLSTVPINKHKLLTAILLVSMASSSLLPRFTAAAAPRAGVLAGKVIALDAGHGGANPGARGPSGSLEKNNVLSTAYQVKKVLEAAGAKVVLTRWDDSEPGLQRGTNLADLKSIIPRRAQIATSHNADVLISIHNDSNTNPTLSGTTTYYWGTPKLGKAIQSALVAQLGSRNVGAKRSGFLILTSARMPAVLVEVGFISNKTEEQRLRSVWYQQQVGLGIKAGLQKYFQSIGA